MKRSQLIITILSAGVGISLATNALATMAFLKKAKELGYPAANCQYCHVEALPKKGAATSNDRGKWLVAEKAKRKAQEVDPAWLKDYAEPKK